MKLVFQIKNSDMDKDQKDGAARSQEQTSQGEKNPTLNEKETSVSDYGNVMGGSSDENTALGQKSGTGRQDANETLGNP